MDPDEYARVVSLACHDLRTPLATVFGFSRTLARGGELDERSARFVGMMGEAADQMAELLDELAVSARIAAGRWEPALREVDTLGLVDGAEGSGLVIETEPQAVGRALGSLARAARVYGRVDDVSWHVDGRVLSLSPVNADAGPVVLADEIRDLGSIVARQVIEALGGSLELDGEALRVAL